MGRTVFIAVRFFLKIFIKSSKLLCTVNKETIYKEHCIFLLFVTFCRTVFKILYRSELIQNLSRSRWFIMAENKKNQQKQETLVLLVSLRVFCIGLTMLGKELLGHTIHGV